MEKNRRIGNSTRAIDYFIQMIFHNPGYKIKIQDPLDNENIHRLLMDRILRRLEIEHYQRVFEIDKNNFTIMLKEGKEGYKRNATT
jgi:hypothetical protein